MQSRPNWYLAGIRLEGIRGFQELDLDLVHGESPRMRNLVIGTNGTGKSTLLRATVLGIAPESTATSLLESRVGTMIAHGRDEARIVVRLMSAEGGDRVELESRLVRKGNAEILKRPGTSDSPRDAFVVGYGVNRTTEGADTGRGRGSVADSTHTLFESNRPLIGAELTLRRMQSSLSPEGFERVLSKLKIALGLERGARIELGERSGVVLGVTSGGHRIPLEGWADGFRVTFQWLLDVFAWAHHFERLDADGQPIGILLLDELEQHLHPELQIELLPRLRRVLPRMQLLGTTHSPLVMLAAEPDEVISLKLSRRKISRVPAPRTMADMTAEDILSSEALFDVSPRSSESEMHMDRYRTLAKKSRRSKAETSELAALATRFLHVTTPTEGRDSIASKLDELIARLKADKS